MKIQEKNMNITHSPKILLVGTGSMAKEYAKVLKVLKRPFLAIGRGEESALFFEKAIGVPAARGGIKNWLRDNADKIPQIAIVATNEEQLGPATRLLLQHGTKSILVEKPGGMNLKDLIKQGKHYRLESTLDFDGAILVDKNGNILDSGIIIEGLRPKVIANKIHPGKFKDLSEQFGFKGKVHSRHLSAITASYIFKGTTVLTVSEENDSFHVFERGKIVYSI